MLGKLFSKLGVGKLASGLADIFTKKKLDQATLDALEELLISADLGPKLAAEMVAALSKSRFGAEVTEPEIKEFLADFIAARLQSLAQPLNITAAQPFVLLMVGVNGSGKTTTLGKLAAQLQGEGKKLMLAAGDTFRAAAVAQLQAWGARAGVPVITLQAENNKLADPAALAFEAVKQAQLQQVDVLLIDTAGRLHNKAELMAELQKTVRAVQKSLPSAPHATVLVLDATTGQNAVVQAKAFQESVGLTGVILTKLDGTAKGGAVVALADELKLPILAIGTGEGLADLAPFDAATFARALVGLPAA